MSGELWVASFTDGAYDLTVVARTKKSAIRKLRSEYKNTNWNRGNPYINDDDEFRCFRIDSDKLTIDGQNMAWR